MLSIIYSSLVYLLEMPITYLFFYSIADVRGRKLFSVLLGIFIFESGAIINTVFNNTIWINFLYLFALFLVFALVCFKIKFYTAVLYSVVLLIFCTALEFATIFMVSAIAGTDTTAYNSDFTLLIIMTVICKFLYFTSCILLMRFIRKRPIWSHYPTNFYIYPIVTFACLIVFWVVCTREQISDLSKAFLAISSILLFASSMILFVVYHHNLEKDSEHLRVKSEYDKLQLEKTYYDILDYKNQQLMIYAHDAKNHLAAIKNLNKDPRIDNYISKLSEQLKSYSNRCTSGNMILDVIINKYASECELRSISFHYDVRTNNLSNVNGTDLVSILGNLLDNAMLAAEKSKAKTVSIETDFRNDYGIIIITNSTVGPPITIGTQLLSTKPDPSWHGYGIKSVTKTLRGYDGDMNWNYDDNRQIFTVTVMLRGTS